MAYTDPSTRLLPLPLGCANYRFDCWVKALAGEEPVMHGHVTTRRAILGGAAACASATVLPTPAEAFWPALITGINTLVVLWNGYKMAEEIYNRFFAEKGTLVNNEVGRVYGSQNFIVQNYYQFGNPYKVPYLSSAEPGCEVVYRPQRDATALCCGTIERPVFLSTGCIVALGPAINELRNSQGLLGTCDPSSRGKRLILRESN
jgi:hypothetical protein